MVIEAGDVITVITTKTQESYAVRHQVGMYIELKDLFFSLSINHCYQGPIDRLLLSIILLLLGSALKKDNKEINNALI